jgi:hypothetical protein
MGLKQKLPKWFDGVIYETGDIVVNPFSGEEYKLNNIELSMYDLIKGAEFLNEWDLVRKSVDWFRKNNPKAYMILLD